MSSAFSSFALIKNSFDDGEDYIGAYVPLLLQLFMKKGYTSISIESICNDFEEEYGFGIPRHPMETILNRMKPRYLVREGLTISINLPEVEKSAGKIDFQSELQKYDWLIENFLDFCNDFQPKIHITREAANTLFIDFLKEHDLDIIFAAQDDDQNNSLFSGKLEINESDQRFLINRYINELMRRGGEQAQYVLQCAIGHNYASTILYREFTNIRGKGTCANYYLDVGLLFDLTGINRSFRRKTAVDLLAILRKKGSRLHIFRHTYEEFHQIIESCLTWIDSDSYDPEKASRAMNFFREEGYSRAEIVSFIANIPVILDKNNIDVVDSVDPNKRQEYQINRDAFKKQLVDFYKSHVRYAYLEGKESTIELDVTSVENIYKLRGDIVPTGLSSAAHVLMTANAGLAYSTAVFDRAEFKRGYFTIPTALTDTLVGTFIWVQEPANLVEDFNKSKLIAYTNAVITPKPNLLRRFKQEVENAERNTINPITEESAIVLLETNIARHLLADKTLGDPNRITAQTPYEILEDLKRSLIREEAQRTRNVLRSFEEERNVRRKTETDLDLQTETIQSWIDSIAVWAKRLVVGLLFVLAILFLGINEFQESKSAVTKVLNYILALISAASGITIIAIGAKTENWIRGNLTNRLLKPKKNVSD